MNLFDFLDLLWQALRGRIGGSPDFIMVYTALGGVLWALLLFKVFLQEGLQVASGHGTELPKIFVKYLFVAGMFAVWPLASDSIFGAIRALADMFYPNLGGLLTTMHGSMEFMRSGMEAESHGLVSTILGTIYNIPFGNAISAIGILVLFFCYALILLNVAGSLTILAMNLVLGPVFFALSFDRDFRSHASHWFAAVLSYLLLIPLYGAAITIAAAIAGAAIPGSIFGLTSTAQISAQLIGPLMSVGVVFSTNKIVNALVGGAAGSGLGSTAVGLAGIGVSLIPGGAMIRSTAMAGRAAASAAGGAAKATGSKLSSSAKSALRG